MLHVEIYNIFRLNQSQNNFVHKMWKSMFLQRRHWFWTESWQIYSGYKLWLGAFTVTLLCEHFSPTNVYHSWSQYNHLPLWTFVVRRTFVVRHVRHLCVHSRLFKLCCIKSIFLSFQIKSIWTISIISGFLLL